MHKRVRRAGTCSSSLSVDSLSFQSWIRAVGRGGKVKAVDIIASCRSTRCLAANLPYVRSSITASFALQFRVGEVIGRNCHEFRHSTRKGGGTVMCDCCRGPSDRHLLLSAVHKPSCSRFAPQSLPRLLG